MKEELVGYLSGFASENRIKLFDRIIDFRTRYLTVAIEDIYQPHNASAVLRTCDCFGIQDVHIVENQNEYKVNPDVALGSSKWLSIIKYNKHENNTLDTISTLKDQGYRIVATTPHTKDVVLDDFDIEKGKAVLFFGTELNGLTDLMINNADEYLKIPMFGFTESFNISVSAAIILHHLTLKLRNSNINWKLSNEEKVQLKYEWLMKTIKKSDLIEKDFLNKNL